MVRIVGAVINARGAKAGGAIASVEAPSAESVET
jgi:hypothetical protein